MSDRTCLSYWLPKLQDAGLPVPRTEIIRTGVELTALLDGQMPFGFATFLASMRDATDRMGYPCFLRTGQTSGKHQWKDTCFLADPAKLGQHIANLVEFSALADFMGLQTNVWVVREMLPVTPVFVLPRYGFMPLVREVRCFIKGGKVICSHNYWPLVPIRDGLETPDTGRAMVLFDDADLLKDSERWMPLAQRAAKVFASDGPCPVDLLETKRGMYITDMAEAAVSYHWPDCPHTKEFLA